MVKCICIEFLTLREKIMHEGHRKRMLEKLTAAGDSLNDHELLEILLYNAYPRINTNTIAHELLATFGTLNGVFSADIPSLMHVKNVGINCASYIKVFSKILQLSQKRENPLPKLYNFYDFKMYLSERFNDLNFEEFVIFLLDKRHKIINEWSCTNSDDTIVMLDVKSITKLLAINRPYSLVAAHNHISGNEQPTTNDDNTTKRLALLCNINNVVFYDHIIVSNKKTYSYHVSGKLSEIIKNSSLENIAKFISNGGN